MVTAATTTPTPTTTTTTTATTTPTTATTTTTTAAPAVAPAAAPRKVTIVLDGDYDTVVGTDKEKFLRECTTSVSSDGAREVECVDVRPGSIVVDLSGEDQAVVAAVAEVETNGLATESFQTLGMVTTTNTTETRAPTPAPESKF